MKQTPCGNEKENHIGEVSHRFPVAAVRFWKRFPGRRMRRFVRSRCFRVLVLTVKRNRMCSFFSPFSGSWASWWFGLCITILS